MVEGEDKYKEIFSFIVSWRWHFRHNYGIRNNHQLKKMIKSKFKDKYKGKYKIRDFDECWNLYLQRTKR